MESVQTRVQWVDTGKYVCILFVMLSHLQSGSQALEAFYTPFFLSGFFFLSGYVYRPRGSFREHFLRKCRQLLLPWFVLSNGNILISMVLNHKEDVDYLARFGWSLLQIRTVGDELWFIAALFVAYIPFYFFAKDSRPGRSLGLMGLMYLLSRLYSQYMPDEIFPWGINTLPWHLEYIFQGGLWMLLGLYFRRYGEEAFDRWNTPVNRWGLWLCYLILVLGPEVPFLENLRDLGLLKEGLGILSLVCLCKSLRGNRYTRFVGANTIVYFAFHGWVYASVELVLGRFFAPFYQACLSNPFTSDLLAVGITLLVSVLLIPPAWLIGKWFPWLLGRRRASHAL